MLRYLPLARLAALHLLGGIEAEVGMARALLRQLDDAEDLGLELGANGGQQVRERRVGRPLAGGPAGGANAPQVSEVGLDRCRQPRHGRMVAAPVTVSGPFLGTGVRPSG